MALTKRWIRGSVQAPSPAYFGHTVIYTPGSAETVLRVHWCWYAHQIFTGAGWAPGTSVTKAGIVFDTGTGSSTPTPISQPDARWLDMQTATWQTETVDVAGTRNWICQTVAPPLGYDTKAMAKQVSVGPALNLSISWETLTSTDNATPFNYAVVGTWSVLIGSTL